MCDQHPRAFDENDEEALAGAEPWDDTHGPIIRYLEDIDVSCDCNGAQAFAADEFGDYMRIRDEGWDYQTAYDWLDSLPVETTLDDLCKLHGFERM